MCVCRTLKEFSDPWHIFLRIIFSYKMAPEDDIVTEEEYSITFLSCGDCRDFVGDLQNVHKVYPLSAHLSY